MQVSEFLKNLVPYQPGKPTEELVREKGIPASEIIKIGSNENPLGPSPLGVAAAINGLIEAHLYPDASHFKIREKLSKKYSLDPKQIVLGNGSNELIEFVIRTFSVPGDNVVMSEAAFAIYKVYSKICGLEIREAKPKGGREGEALRDFKFDADAICELVDEKTRAVFIDNPNNPTGTYLSHSEVESVCERLKNYPDLAVVLDNAYEEYVSVDDYPDWRRLLDKYPNLLILRTYSKAYGLAGLRVGYAIGNEELIFYLNQMRAPFNVSRVALCAVLAATDDGDHIENTVTLNRKMLDYFYREFDRMGLHYPESQGNSVLVDVGRSGPEVYERLLDRGVIARPVVGYGFKNHLRICTSTEQASEKVVHVLEEVLKKS